MDWGIALGSVIVVVCAIIAMREIADGGINWGAVVPILFAAVVGRLVAHRARRPARSWLHWHFSSEEPGRLLPVAPGALSTLTG